MDGYIGITDPIWFNFHKNRDHDEVIFWRRTNNPVRAPTRATRKAAAASASTTTASAANCPRVTSATPPRPLTTVPSKNISKTGARPFQCERSFVDR